MGIFSFARPEKRPEEEAVPSKIQAAFSLEEKLEIEGRALRGMIEELNGKTFIKVSLSAELETALADLAATDRELATLGAELARSDRDLVLTGGKVPEDLTPEEIRIARTKRKRRIDLARVALLRENIGSVQGEIASQVAAVESEFSALGKKIYLEAVDDFNAAAEKLIIPYARMIAFWVVFQWNGSGSTGTGNVPFPGYACVQNILKSGEVERWLITSPLSTTDTWMLRAGDFPSVLREIATSVENARKGGINS